jgi:hypothetical protein
MWEDKIVAEVRSVRQAHAEKFDFDLPAIYQDLKDQEEKSGRATVSFPPKRPIPVQPAQQTVLTDSV